jgi:predicted AAA+ superfamily ATPase
MKLLAKSVESRYQTADGLGRDLRLCLEQWDRQGHIDAFPLGERDVPHRLAIPEKLYGREREVEALLAAFNRVAAGGRAELLLVAGYSGVGKSSVVNELHKALLPSRDCSFRARSTSNSAPPPTRRWRRRCRASCAGF